MNDRSTAGPGRLGLTAFRRGLAKRCPNCGAGGLFPSYFTMVERCSRCGLAYEREEGYWLGAMVVAIGLTEALFGVFFVGGMLLTWPEVPWGWLLVGGLLLNLVVPIVSYPWCKTTWVGLHLAFVPPEASEEAAAIAAIDAHRRQVAIQARDAASDGGPPDPEALPGSDQADS